MVRSLIGRFLGGGGSSRGRGGRGATQGSTGARIGAAVERFLRKRR